jgi:hypothetical protein
MRSAANLVSGCGETAFAAACARHRSRLCRRTTERSAIAPQVGGPRIVAAAPEIMVAFGLSLPEGGDFD